MFGYILPVKAEMKVRDFESYRAMYCGLCKQLGQSHGIFSRFLLNYDLVLLALMADALSGQQGETRLEGCFANPAVKRATRHNTTGLALAADSLVILTYHKLQDHISDESMLKRFGYLLLRPPMHRMLRKAANRQKEIADVVTKQMECQRNLEAAGCANIDEACEPTARMCEALFSAAARDEASARILARLGLFAGQVVYLLDAAEDYAADAKENRYNVFLQAGIGYDEAIERTKRHCRMAAGEIALCYNLLDIRQYKEILDNIFFLGLPTGIAKAGQDKRKGGAGHGQIDRV